MKINFIRKPTYEELIPQKEILIEKVIVLEDGKFNGFIHNLIDDYDFIKKNADLMYVDENSITHCILVKSKTSDFGILVKSEGFDYARYAAHVMLSSLIETRLSQKELNKELENIVRKHMVGIDTLEQRMDDSLDFHEVSVWSLESALKAAFELGMKEGKK